MPESKQCWLFNLCSNVCRNLFIASLEDRSIDCLIIALPDYKRERERENTWEWHLLQTAGIFMFNLLRAQ